VAAFAVTSLLANFGAGHLAIKSVAERRHEAEIKAAAQLPPERPLLFPLPLGGLG
jgi:sulfate/thiosulfate transport system permease protein